MQFIVGIVGVTAGKESNNNHAAVSAMIAFICFNISFFAATWGPCAWVVIERFSQSLSALEVWVSLHHPTGSGTA